MRFSNIILAKQIIDFVDSCYQCSIPDVKDHLKIPTGKPPTPEEKNVYRLIDILHKEGYLIKERPKDYYPGGSRFILTSTPSGVREMSKLNVKGKSVTINSQEIKEKIMEFSDENKEIISDLLGRVFDILPKTRDIDKDNITSRFKEFHRQQDKKLLQIFNIE